MRIDAHQHFWEFDPVRDSWITEEMAVIRRNFLPEDFYPVLAAHFFDGCIAVQADQSEAETKFLLDLAEKYDFIKGIVGWVDLRSKDLPERLEYFSQYKDVKGFRHVLQGEEDRALMLRPEFKRGIAALREFDFTYDILIFPDQIGYATELVASFPGQKFVIDHLAKPDIKNGKLDVWKEAMKPFRDQENVFCKVSGMVTEHAWKSWKKEDFRPYMDAVLEIFGIDRLMFGSDWPVCLVAASYKQMLEIVESYFSSFSTEDQAKFFGGNAALFYGI